MQIRHLTAAVSIAVALAACGGTDGAIVEPLAGGDDGDVLSACSSPSDQETTVLVEATGSRPELATMEAALAQNPDAQFVIDELVADGASREDAVHDMYGQVVGDRLLADAIELPGYVSAAYARPSADEPFRLVFAGEVPEEFDPSAYELGSYGLEVTTGGAGLDEEASSAAFEAARAAGIRVVSGSGDEVTGTTTIEVIDATAEQVEAWEASLDEPGRICMVRAPRAEGCDDAVIADARERADRQGELFPADEDDVSDEDGSVDPDRAEVVGRSYLGLTEADAREKATAEARSVRTVIEDGVGLGVDDDLQPSRMNLSVCDGVVVDATLDGDL